MGTLTVASPLLTEVGAIPLTPAQRAALWELAAVLDERHVPVPTDPSYGDAVWVRVSAQRLRGKWGRDDNVWLRKLLDRLIGVRLGGRAGTDAWGGVIVAQYRITDGGRVVDLLLPPAGLAALRAPATFAKIDSEAAHRLPPHARTLYGLLADRNRQTNRRWRVEVDDLKIRLGVPGRYKGRFNDFRRWVLDPAVSAINDFGVIFIENPLLLERLGRQVHAVVFVWNLKDFPSAAKTAGEADRHSIAAGKHQDSVDAPPLTGSAPERDASAGQHRPLPFLRWRDGLPPDERKAMATKYALGPRGHRLADHPGLWQDAWDGEGRPAPSAATER